MLVEPIELSISNGKDKVFHESNLFLARKTINPP